MMNSLRLLEEKNVKLEKEKQIQALVIAKLKNMLSHTEISEVMEEHAVLKDKIQTMEQEKSRYLTMIDELQKRSQSMM